MGGISEALVATAVGLLVAIPAVVLYNGFTRWVKSRMARSESLSQLVLARINGEAHGK
jgi:biopolymer transport protein ExbB